MSNWIASRLGLKADRVEAFVALARAALLWERVWRSLWPASGIVGLYAAAALAGLIAWLPGWLHFLLLTAVLWGAGILLYRRWRDLRVPNWQEGARRLERDSRLAHGPITERDDTIAAGAGDPYAEALWRAHVKRLLASIGRLCVAWPSPGLPAADPKALRFLVLLLVIAGAAIAGSGWRARLETAFLPPLEIVGPAATLDAWINPPGYTGEAPIYLSHGSEAPIAVPAGSKLVLHVHGARDVPELSLDPSPQTVPVFTGTGGEYAGTARLTQSGSIALSAGEQRLGRWDVKIIPDRPPVIAFAAPPARTAHDAVKLSFTAGDDYGIAKVRALIRPRAAKGKSEPPLIVDLPVDSTTTKTLSQTAYEDLTGHPYAGLEVTIVLEAVDGAGQVGKSKPVAFRLPARLFTDPLARALIEQRQNLALGGMTAVPKAALTLDALTIAPEQFYADKPGIYLAIRSAYWSLKHVRFARQLAPVEDLLWQTALALENGGLADAAAELRRVQQMLSQALAQGAPQSVIDQLLQRYQQAMQNYLQQMAKNAQAGNTSTAPNAKMLSQQDLEDLLKAIQQLAQTGARGQAAQALAMLQSLLENLQMQAGNGSGRQSPADQALNEAVGKLGDLMGKERQLLDKTYRHSQGAGDPKDGGGKGLSRQQGALKDELGKILKGLGEQKQAAPQSLGKAGRSMGEAQGELGRQDFDGAGDAEKDALEAMRQAAGELAQKLMARKGQGGQPGAGEDPLGRLQNGPGGAFGGTVKMPDKSVIERAREILKELRRRAAERGRPKEELDYIDRLLKEF
ncbi:MAG: TIGR02302 family protein [Alphaproteobacteria bacterium]|nr:TIGR02302 family protein [Alphaproteobacteria bacterium]